MIFDYGTLVDTEEAALHGGYDVQKIPPKRWSGTGRLAKRASRRPPAPGLPGFWSHLTCFGLPSYTKKSQATRECNRDG